MTMTSIPWPRRRRPRRRSWTRCRRSRSASTPSGPRRRPPPVESPWPSSSRDGHVRHRVDAEAPEREHQLGEPGQPVRVEVAEHHDALARPRRAPRSGRRTRSASGSSRGSCRPASRGRGTRRAPPASAIPRRASTVVANMPRPSSRAAARSLRVEAEGLREDPAVTRVDHRRRGCHDPAYPGLDGRGVPERGSIEPGRSGPAAAGPAITLRAAAWASRVGGAPPVLPEVPHDEQRARR